MPSGLPYRVVAPFLRGPDEIHLILSFCQSVTAGRELPSSVMPYYEPTPTGSRLLRIERFVTELDGETGTNLLQRCERLAGELLGEPVVLFKDKINFRYPGSPGFPAHQDSAAGWERYASVFASVMVTLEDSAPETGGFEFPREAVPRTLLPNVDGRLSDALFERLDPQPLRIPAGSALVFDSYAPHRTVANRSNRVIPHILLTFNRAAEGNQLEQYYTDKAASLKARDSGYTFRLFDFGSSPRR